MLPEAEALKYDCETCIAREWYASERQRRHCRPVTDAGTPYGMPAPRTGDEGPHDAHAPDGWRGVYAGLPRSVSKTALLHDGIAEDTAPIRTCLRHAAGLVEDLWVAAFLRWETGDYIPHEWRTPFYGVVIQTLAHERAQWREARMTEEDPSNE